MSESYDPTEDGTESEDTGGALSTTSSPLGVLPGQSAGDESDSPVAALRAATARLKAQRSGLSGTQQLAALLTGFGQPSAHAGWQSGVVNAAQALQTQQLAARKADQARQDLITKYDLASAHYQAQNEASTQRTAELAQAAKERAAASAAKAQTPDNEARFRLGMAKLYFPGVPEAEIVARNLLYDPKVNGAALNWRAANSMAASGEVLPPPAPPTLGDFLVKARAANPGVSDADLRGYYIKKYGGQ